MSLEPPPFKLFTQGVLCRHGFQCGGGEGAKEKTVGNYHQGGVGGWSAGLDDGDDSYPDGEDSDVLYIDGGQGDANYPKVGNAGSDSKISPDGSFGDLWRKWP